MKVKIYPTSPSMDVPAMDGSVLKVVLDRDVDGGISHESTLRFREYVDGGERALVSYRLGSLRGHHRPLTLHDGIPGLTVPRRWMVSVLDWAEMFQEDIEDGVRE